MPALTEAVIRDLDLAQALELSLLVELEARWENLKAPARAEEVGPATQQLLGVQKAYDAFRNQLVAYNKQYMPPHVPERLLNTPSRLAAWYRAMRALYLRVESQAQGRCPLQLLEKAY